MDETERLKQSWRKILARTGDGGRAFRKSLVTRVAAQIPETAVRAADPEHVKAAIKAERARRAAGHWAFRPERLRALLALYLRVRALSRRT